jgi:cytochrome c556
MRSMVQVLAVSVALATSYAVSAAEPAEVIKFRQNVMKVNGALMANATAILQGKADEKGRLADIGRALELNNKDTASLFPAGTETGGDTKALPSIWQKRADFERLAKELQDKAAAFARSTAGNDAQQIAAAHKELAGTCRACHTDYRKQ